ncbi:MAG: hypothetical protein EOP06_22795 [Proteobacteria bacterium]|nr:MAG: hypothetical protein EOP06_22795 [Pseudomonadota bacterium]
MSRIYQGLEGYGDYVAKIIVRPASENVKKLTEVKHKVDGNFSAVRDDVSEFFRTGTAEYEVCVQLCTDLEKMPVEDLAVQWSESESPFRPVARIVIKPQDSYSPARRVYGDDVLSFSPAHALAAHRPLGSIMRTRLKVYGQASAFRHQINAINKVEPRSIDELPA